MDIIHLSDLHFGDAQAPFNEVELSEALSNYIIEHTTDPIVILSGDITVRGQSSGYSMASTFVENLINMGRVNRNCLCFCPGNHDIVNNSFEAFDRFVYGARRDNVLAFNNASYNVLEIQGVVFVMLNSSFHLNHQYGLVDNTLFNLDLSSYAENKKILVFHHHILNQFNGDTSAIRNSYKLVQFIENKEFCLALHGHQHTEQHYHLGKTATPVVSARSGNFNQSGYLNAFNHYKLTGEEIMIDSLVFERSTEEVSIRRLVR
ncbi:metallophosphoesterase [Aliivibrio fischeri]|uniref:metallophosphoesterase family protein n=1 Tax=Aliivibrio fischeri TaxID=668 RepID=UPI00080DA4F0|nr:metallophosphoesterase [Aliivibrio fischeri]OCH58391.1 metallophosphoesterase [Aliivibrio fischeri]